MKVLFFMLLLAVSALADEGIDTRLEEAEMKLVKLQKQLDRSQSQAKTRYDATTGRPVGQKVDAKGWHPAEGSVDLSGGSAVVTINTSIENDAQDMSFTGDSTYSGVAWGLDSSSTTNYFVVPLNGHQFYIRSSDTNDSSTIRYRLEGY